MLRIVVLLSALVACVAVTGCGRDLGTSRWSRSESTESNIARVLQIKEFGVAFTDVYITRKGQRACDSSGLYARRVGDDRIMPDGLMGFSILPPGDYVVESAFCSRNLSQSVTRIEGPHAKFRIEPGELVDLGFFRIDFDMQGFIFQEGSARRGVIDLDKHAMAKLEKDIPNLLPQMVKRHMELVGSSTSSIKPRYF